MVDMELVYDKHMSLVRAAVDIEQAAMDLRLRGNGMVADYIKDFVATCLLGDVDDVYEGSDIVVDRDDVIATCRNRIYMEKCRD